MSFEDMLDRMSKNNERMVANKIGGKAPAAKGEIDPTIANALATRLKALVSKLSGRTFDVETMAAPTKKLPPQVYSMLVGWQKFVEHAKKQGLSEFDEYTVDPEKIAADPDAMVEATSMLARAMQDKSLMSAVRKGGPKSPDPDAASEKDEPPGTSEEAEAESPAPAKKYDEFM